MTDYFGYNVDGQQSGGLNDRTAGNYKAVWVCPGTGLQNIVDLSMLGYMSAGGLGGVRLAVYSSDFLQKIAEGAEVSLFADSKSWYGHLGRAACGNGQLMGGTAYGLVTTVKNYSGECTVYYDLSQTDDSQWWEGEYTDGFPASLALANSVAALYCIRCGVVPAGRALHNSMHVQRGRRG